MKPEGAPFFAILLAVLLGIIWAWINYSHVTFDEPKDFQFNSPAIEEGGSRFGREATRIEAAEIERFSLVRYRVPRTGRVVTSRVVAVEGERVALSGKELAINGSPVADPYVRRGHADEFYPELIVPARCVFVLNDQRRRQVADRMDSRNLGPIPVDAILQVFSPREPSQARAR